ncbi:g2436 [Coccomyxa elongata]
MSWQPTWALSLMPAGVHSPTLFQDRRSFLAYPRSIGAMTDSKGRCHRARVVRLLVLTALLQVGSISTLTRFGFASEELDVPLRDYHIFPVGSNTKFFTAVAIYQLQEKGLLNVSDAIGKRIHRPCTLWSRWTMVPYYPWIDKLELSYGALTGSPGNWLNGEASAADLLRFQNSMHLPMLHAPGVQYCHVNTNFNTAGYVVEKLTNMSFTSYLKEFILRPANLSNTYYWLGGQGMEPQGIRKNVVSIPGYTTTFTNQTTPGAPAFQVVNRVDWLPTDLSTVASAAGAMFSNVFDLLKWYNTFNAHPEVIGLSKESLALLTEPLEPVTIPLFNGSYAQGVGVDPLPASKMLDYTGGIWGYLTHIQYWVNPSDPSKSDAVLFFSNVNPVIPSGPNGTCSVRSAQNGALISLDPGACNPNGADMTTYVTNRIAQMWNITGSYSSS